jgi:hypothetical protein
MNTTSEASVLCKMRIPNNNIDYEVNTIEFLMSTAIVKSKQRLIGVLHKKLIWTISNIYRKCTKEHEWKRQHLGGRKIGRGGEKDLIIIKQSFRICGPGLPLPLLMLLLIASPLEKNSEVFG